jgi:8-oxo-dGTP pyrophosphatase MutT (NUDIX family)
MAWEVLTSRQVLDLSPWLTVTTQRIRLPNGTILPDYVLAPPREFSMAVAVDNTGRIVLLRQYKHGLGREAIELPAGYLESPDEPPLECAQRELREETGFIATHWKPLGNFNLDANRGPSRCHFFLATGLSRQGERQLEASEDIQVFFAAPGEAFDMLLGGEIEPVACATALMLGLLAIGFLKHP